MTRILPLAAAFLAAAAFVWGVVSLRASAPVSERPAVEIGASPSTVADSAPDSIAPTATTTTLASSWATLPTTPADEAGESIYDFAVASGRAVDVAVIDSGPRPVWITIDDIAVTAGIDPVGFVAETNEMEVPTSHDLVGWYQYSPTPGSAEGSSVLAAHVDYNGRAGVFFDLGKVEDGAIVTIDFEDGSQRLFSVVSGQQYDKAALPVDDIFSKSGDPVLTLITCGGAFDSSARSYEDNVVITAVPIESGFERS